MPRAAARIIVTLAVLAFAGAIAMAVFAALSHAQNQPPRLALLIGNQNYATKVGPLKNPRQDVALIEASLKRLGFQVTVLNDADYRAMDVALKRYVRELRGAGAGALGFFYYSGHGAAHAETQINYLIPVDVASAEDDGIWDQSFQQNQIIDLLSKQGSNATQFAVFDACRNELHLSGGAAKAIGGEKGFVPVANTAGLLIAYATAPGRTASDAGEGGGPYAKALAEELLKPGVEAVTMFRNVQIKVKQSIGQDPWLSFPSLAPVYLAGQVAAVAEAPKPQAQSPLGPDAQAWSLVQNSQSEAVLEEFARRFPDSVYWGFASARLDELRRQKEASKDTINTIYSPGSRRPNREQVISFLRSYNIESMGKPEDLLRYYAAGMHNHVLQVRREVNRIWPLRHYELLVDSVAVSDAGPDRLLVRYRVRTLTRNGSTGRDRVWKNEATLSFLQGGLKIEEEKVLGWEDQ